jgi:rhamnose utilization protein RhaD (predicted bifunctional aldolase and dehydrogenase)
MEDLIILQKLIDLAHELGCEERELAILGEGNLSADCGDGTFWVKASGSRMMDLEVNGVCRVRFDEVNELSLLEEPTQQEVISGLRKALVDKDMGQPSVETFLHSVCLQKTGSKFIGHTHPTSMLSILCSKLGAEPFLKHIFPEPIPICGIAPAVVPYVDPGFALGAATETALDKYAAKYQTMPKMILMVNHGLVALGQSPEQVLAVTLIANKWAKALKDSILLGGPRYFSDETVKKFANRLDEKLRKID